MENNNTSIHYYIKQWLKQKFAILFVIFIIILLIFVFFFNRIVVVIGPGQAGVLFKLFSGTQIDRIYDEGIHLFSPLDTVFIYEVRKQVSFHEFDVISNKGLTIHLSLAVRYRPEYDLLGILHQRIGPDYLKRVILPQIESVMRKELGNYTAEQIYTNEAGLLTKAILAALDEVGRNYVEVEDIIIRSITLPPDIVAAIETKLKQEEFMKSYEFRLQTAEKEAARLKIEAEGIKTYHNTINGSLSEAILRNKGIEATEKLAGSANAKVVVIGGGKDGLPLILNTGSSPADPPATPTDSTASPVDASASAPATPETSTPSSPAMAAPVVSGVSQ